MRNFKKKITNPMTVIAIFAFISETSAAVSLPFLDNNEREIYIWFLISFPFYLLFLFFITLNFNYRSLYAPSDFAEDDNFLKAFEELKSSDHQHDPLSKTSECPGNVADPPTGSGWAPPPWIEHNVQLPKPMNALRVIDVRPMNSKAQFDQLQASLTVTSRPSVRFMVFLTDPVSDALLKQIALSPGKQTKKGTTNTVYIAYNVSQQITTILRGD
ncbi:hypothetical protein ACP3TY_03020 [Pseudomonas rustica]|jgi:hypothetical protein|uniref:hypothetical protein n=1 Tax=Pseudomonas rustica TaxID=2827099 RepID=UPI003CFAAE92